MSMPSQHYGRGSANSIHFFQQIQSQDLQHEEIRIQRSFVERYWKGVSNPITLSLPNGSLWKMFWVKRGEDIWLQKKNWKTFARSLRCGDALFFKYKGEGSEFKVKIFDDTSLEIDYSSMRREDSDDDDECVEITNDGTKTSTQVKEEKNDNSTQEQTNSKRKINLDDDDDTLQNVLAAKKAKKCSNTEAVKERAENCHSMDDDQYPSFEISLAKSYVENSFMVMPKDFSREHMKGWEGKAIIRAAHDMSTSWEMTIKNSSTFFNERSMLGSGWKKFAQNYNLQVNDICKFVMTQRDPMSFTITIPHVKVQPCPQKLQDSQDLNDNDGVKVNTFKKTITTDNDGVKVNTFKKTITTTEYMHIPRKFMKRHGRCQGIVKLKFGETSWLVKLTYYENGDAGRFHRGWANFVKACNLKIGDTCLFELIDEENHVFNVTRLN